MSSAGWDMEEVEQVGHIFVMGMQNHTEPLEKFSTHSHSQAFTL